MGKQWELPAGMDLEQVTAYAVELERKKRREWNQRNPEKVEAQRIRTYQKYLQNRGYTVIPPDGGAFHG